MPLGFIQLVSSNAPDMLIAILGFMRSNLCLRIESALGPFASIIHCWYCGENCPMLSRVHINMVDIAPADTPPIMALEVSIL